MFYSKYTDKVQAQVIDYKTKCFPFASVGSLLFLNPCKFYFLPDGIFFSQPARQVTCCSFQKGVGPVPPNFLRAFHLAAPADVAKDMWGRDVTTERWEADGDFAYWTVAHGDEVYPEMWGHDIAFQDGPTMVTWRFGLFNVEPQDDTLFALPASTTQCQQSCPWFGAPPADVARAAFPLHAKHSEARPTEASPSPSTSSAGWEWAGGSGGGRKCRRAGTEGKCVARGCQWCVSIDLEWCQETGGPCKEASAA